MGFNYTDDENYNYNNLQEDPAQSVLDDVMEDQDKSKDQSSGETIREKAIRQMEHANLYRVLLENNIFAPNSARPEIQSKVEAEIKEFIESKLVELLNIGEATKKSIELPFDQTEILALKTLAQKLTAKLSNPNQDSEPKTSLPTPSLNEVNIKKTKKNNNLPKLNNVQVSSNDTLNKKLKSQQVSTVGNKNISNMTPEEVRNEIKKRKSYKTVDNPKKISMPSLAEQEALYLNQMRQLNNPFKGE